MKISFQLLPEKEGLHIIPPFAKGRLGGVHLKMKRR
jgi:hypothetical protein